MRTQLLVVTTFLGIVVGAAATHALHRRATHVAPDPDTKSLDTVRDSGPSAPPSEASTNRGATAERAQIYARAAAANADELEELIHAATANPPGASRTFELDALLSRYAELDPPAAVAAAQTLGPELRAPLYAAWAMQDAASALAALSEVEDAATARAAALAMWPVLGGDDRALRQVSAAVPFGAESGVYSGALTRLAATDPAGAFQRSIELTDAIARGDALLGVVQTWVSIDASAAVAAAESIADPALRRTTLSMVGRAWARADADAALGHLATLDPRSRMEDYLAFGSSLAQLRPRDILALDAGQSPSAPFDNPLRMLALQTIVSEDPDGALREVEKIPPGPRRDGMFMALARSYGDRDPDAALEWARRSNDANRTAAVIAGMAQRDPMRALDEAERLDDPQVRTQSVQSIVMQAGYSTAAARSTQLADRLMALTDVELRMSSLRVLLSAWSSRAPQDAVDWVAAHSTVELSGSYRGLAAQLARVDAARAAQATERLPAQARTEWITGIADGYAESDPTAAAAWLAQYRGDPAYEPALASVAMGLARTDPAAAARLLGSAERGNMAQSAAPSIAAAWAVRDPLAAATWAEDFDTSASTPNTVPRVVTVPIVVSVWARSDRLGARSWALRRPRGPSRDSAIGALLTMGGEIDETLLNALEDPAMRRQAILGAAMTMANRDRATALRWIDQYIDDPTQREQARRMLERLPPGASFYPSQVPGGLAPINPVTGVREGVMFGPTLRAR